MTRRKATIWRYTAFGVAFGLLFPAFAFFLEMAVSAPGAFRPLALVRANPILAIVLLAPFVLGGVFSVIGRGQARLKAQLVRRAAAERAMWRLANLDSLTGLGNRRSLIDAIGRTLRTPGAPLPELLLVDLDRFKFVNDTLGHDVGDGLLRAFAERVASALGDDERLYRLGGDEFVVVDFTGAAGDRLAQRLIGCFADPFHVLGTQVVSSGSVGVASVCAGEASASPAMGRADLALYRAKATPGSSWARFRPEMAKVAHRRLSMERDIRDGLARGEFHVEYQPIVTVAGRAIRGFEALVRWNHPTRGAIPPDSFIPLAEVSGLILPLGAFVLRSACAAATAWPATVGVSVNVSAMQLRQSDFEAMVRSALAETGLDPARLTIEITESMLIADIESVADSIVRLRAAGVRFALDDFGTGFSSINHLRQIKLDFLKLDQSFVRRVRDDGREAGIIRSVVELARQFDLTTIAEGVEDLEELDLMTELGAAQVQGFFLARPMAADAVPRFLLDAMTASEADGAAAQGRGAA